MKIGVLPSTFPKASKTFILNQITGMLDRGHDVSIFAPGAADESIQHPEIRAYNVLDRITDTAAPDALPVALLGAARNALALGASHPRSLPTLYRIAREEGAREAGRFTYRARPILRADVDVLHAHFGPVGRWATHLDRIGACDAFVTSFHGWGIREGERRGGEIYADLFDRCDCLLANTEYTRERLVAFGADPDTVRVHHVGIDPEHFQSNARASDPESTTILTVARLHRVKGLEHGVHAIEQLAERLPDADLQYRIVGGGPLADDLRELIRKHDLEDTVTLCGPMDRPGVAEELAAADVFLLPSLREAFGMVLLEAQASELPIVASDVGGVREAIVPGESALLVPPRNPGAIANRLAELVANPSKRARIGSAGSSNIEQNFNIHRLNDRLATIYQDLL